MDSILEHITLPRESQMGIPNLTPLNLEAHLQTMRTHGQYRQNIDDLIEAQQQSEELSSKKSFFWSIIFWCILFAFIIIIVIFTCNFFSSYQFFYKTFLTALNQVNRKTLRSFL
jgi:uncharacterized membrane protein YvbJ